MTEMVHFLGTFCTHTRARSIRTPPSLKGYVYTNLGGTLGADVRDKFIRREQIGAGCQLTLSRDYTFRLSLSPDYRTYPQGPSLSI